MHGTPPRSQRAQRLPRAIASPGTAHDMSSFNPRRSVTFSAQLEGIAVWITGRASRDLYCNTMRQINKRFLCLRLFARPYSSAISAHLRETLLFCSDPFGGQVGPFATLRLGEFRMPLKTATRSALDREPDRPNALKETRRRDFFVPRQMSRQWWRPRNPWTKNDLQRCIARHVCPRRPDKVQSSRSA